MLYFNLAYHCSVAFKQIRCFIVFTKLHCIIITFSLVLMNKIIDRRQVVVSTILLVSNKQHDTQTLHVALNIIEYTTVVVFNLKKVFFDTPQNRCKEYPAHYCPHTLDSGL